MMSKKLFNIGTLLVLALILITAGCGGQKSATEQTQGAAVPAAQPAQIPAQDTTGQATAPTSTAVPSTVEVAKTTETKPAQQVAPAKETAQQAATQTMPVETAPAQTVEQPAATQVAEVPKPAPQVIEVTVPSGTILDVAFLDALSSKTSKVGDTFRAEVKREIIQDAMVAIPVGSIVKGTVTEAVSLKKIGGQAKLALDFSTLELPDGHAVPIKASFAEQGKSETGKDAATIGGATAGGALLGRVLGKKDKGKATVIGAILGAAAGTVIAAKTEGQEVEVPAGSEISLQLTEPTKVNVTY